MSTPGTEKKEVITEKIMTAEGFLFGKGTSKFLGDKYS